VSLPSVTRRFGNGYLVDGLSASFDFSSGLGAELGIALGIALGIGFGVGLCIEFGIEFGFELGSSGENAGPPGKAGGAGAKAFAPLP